MVICKDLVRHAWVLMIVGCTVAWAVEMIKVVGCFLLGLKGVHNDVGLTVVERKTDFGLLKF